MFIDFEKIDALVAGMRDELVRDVQKWVAVPSVQSEALE